MKKDYSNIFEAAAENARKKKPPKTVQENKPIPTLPTASISDQERKDMIDQMHKFQKEIASKLESVYERSGLTPRTLGQYLELLKNYGGSIRKDKALEERHLEEQINNVMENAGIKPKNSTHEKQSSKERKAKTIASRQRWLPMH